MTIMGLTNLPEERDDLEPRLEIDSIIMELALASFMTTVRSAKVNIVFFGGIPSAPSEETD